MKDVFIKPQYQIHSDHLKIGHIEFQKISICDNDTYAFLLINEQT